MIGHLIDQLTNHLTNHLIRHLSAEFSLVGDLSQMPVFLAMLVRAYGLNEASQALTDRRDNKSPHQRPPALVAARSLGPQSTSTPTPTHARDMHMHIPRPACTLSPLPHIQITLTVDPCVALFHA